MTSKWRKIYTYQRAEQNQTPNRFRYPGGLAETTQQPSKLGNTYGSVKLLTRHEAESAGRADHPGASTSNPQGKPRPQGAVTGTNTQEPNMGERLTSEGGEPNIYNQGQLVDMLERLGVDLRPMPRPSYMKPYPD